MVACIDLIMRIRTYCKTEFIAGREAFMWCRTGSKLNRYRVVFANSQPAHSCPQELDCRDNLRDDLPAGVPSQELKFAGVI